MVEKESGVALEPAQADVFLCGNPDMVKAVKAMLEAKGFKTDQPGNREQSTSRNIGKRRGTRP